MFWLGIILGFCLGTLGAYDNFEKKIKKVNDLEELKKIL